MIKNNIIISILQVLMSMAGFYLLFAALFWRDIHGWSLFSGILIFVILAIWAILECLPRETQLTSLSSDLTPLLNLFLPRALAGVNLGSLSVILQFENSNPLADIAFMSFLLFSILYISFALFVYQVHFDRDILTYKGLLFSNQIQIHEVKAFKKYLGVFYQITFASKTRQGRLFFVSHFIDRRCVEGNQTSFRKFISCYLEAHSKLRDNDRV